MRKEEIIEILVVDSEKLYNYLPYMIDKVTIASNDIRSAEGKKYQLN